VVSFQVSARPRSHILSRAGPRRWAQKRTPPPSRERDEAAKAQQGAPMMPDHNGLVAIAVSRCVFDPGRASKRGPTPRGHCFGRLSGASPNRYPRNREWAARRGIEPIRRARHVGHAPEQRRSAMVRPADAEPVQGCEARGCDCQRHQRSRPPMPEARRSGTTV